MYSLTYPASSETISDYDFALVYDRDMQGFDDLPRRIVKARRDAGLTQGQLALATGKTRGAVTQWESGEVRPRHSTLTKIAKATGKDLLWLESGVDQSNTGLWVVGEVAAGSWREAAAMLKPYALPVTPHPDYPAAAQRMYRVSGNSMNLVAQDGEYLHCVDVLAADIGPVNGDMVVVCRLEHGRAEYSVKRFLVIAGEKVLRPQSNDPEFQSDLVLDGNDDTETRITDIVIASWKAIPRGRP